MIFGCCAAIFGFVVVLAIAAVILRAACGLAKTDVPEFGHAMMVVFLMAVFQFLVNMGINFAFQVPIVQDPNAPPPDGALGASLASMVINIPLQMLLIWKLVPTPSFGKAALVWLMQLLIVLAIVAVIAGIVFAFAMAGVL